MTTYDVDREVHVRIVVNNPEAITRVTGPEGDEWRRSLYPLCTEEDVLNHWAYNCISNGVGTARRLDGWADLDDNDVIMWVEDVW